MTEAVQEPAAEEVVGGVEQGDEEGIGQSGEQQELLAAFPGPDPHTLHGEFELSCGRAEQAEALFSEEIENVRGGEMERSLGALMYGLGLARQVQGDHARARRHFEEAAALLRAQGDAMTRGGVTRALGAICLIQRDYAPARHWFGEAVHVSLSVQHQEGVAGALQGIAAALAPQGKIHQAAELWGAGQRILDELCGTTQPAGEIPLARLPQLSPHLEAMSAYFDHPEWAAAYRGGYGASLDSALATALDAQQSDIHHPAIGHFPT